MFPKLPPPLYKYFANQGFPTIPSFFGSGWRYFFLQFLEAGQRGPRCRVQREYVRAAAASGHAK